MTIGRGYGVPFGGSPLLPSSQPQADVGGEPTTIDFTDEPDGPFPGAWEFVRRTTISGEVSGDAEPAPFPLYYRVKDGLAWFDYTQHPFSGDNTEHGYVAAPVGIVLGGNVSGGIIARSPLVLLDRRNADEFVYEVTVALRCSDDVSGYVGARARAAWLGGVWTTPVAFEAVRAAGADPVVIGAYPFDPTSFRALEDVWAPQDRMELRARVVGTKLICTLNGVWKIEADVTADGSPKVAVLVKVYNRRGGARVTVPSVEAMQFLTLRDLTKLPPGAVIPGSQGIDNPPLSDLMLLPLLDLTAKGFFKRRGGRQWVVVSDVSVEANPSLPGKARTFTAGTVIRATEPVGSQDLVPCVVDLAATHTSRLKEGG